MNKEIIGIVAGIVSILGCVPYIFSIFKGKTKPSRATWLIWTLVSLLLFASYMSSGAKETIWIPALYALMSSSVAVLSIWYGEGGWNRFDRNCLLASSASLVMWVLFNEPLIALSINIFIDFIGCLPIMRKTYYEPDKESSSAWLLFFTGNVINLFAIKSWIFAICAYPLYLFIFTGIITGLVFEIRFVRRIYEIFVTK